MALADSLLVYGAAAQKYVDGNTEGIVPNVVGMGLSDALSLLELHGLSVTHSGYGTVATQSLKAGEEIGDNKTIHLTHANVFLRLC